MGVVEIPVDAAWVVGFLLALIRIGAFVILSPIIGRAIPATGRMAFAVAVALAMAQPIHGLSEVGPLVAAAGVNAIVGGALGWVSGLIMHLFASAGGVIDLISGLSVSMVFDPMQGEQGGVFTRMFHLTATTMFVLAGGMGLLVGGLVASANLLPLDGSLAPQPGLVGYVVDTVALMVRRGVELALPVMGVMLMLELAFGLAARFAPQTNVFLLGLPAKLFTSITVVGSAWVLFPDAMADAESYVGQSIEVVLRGLGAQG